MINNEILFYFNIYNGNFIIIYRFMNSNCFKKLCEFIKMK